MRWVASARETSFSSRAFPWAADAPSGGIKTQSARIKRRSRTSAANRGVGCHKQIVLLRGITNRRINIFRTTRAGRRARTTIAERRRRM